MHSKVVSTLDKRNTKSHLINLKSRQEGLLAIIHDKRREHDRTISAARRHLFLRKAASNYLYIGDCLEFLCFYWLVRLYSNEQTSVFASAELVQRIHEAVASSDSAAGGPAGSEHPQGAVFHDGKPLNAVCCPQESHEICM